MALDEREMRGCMVRFGVVVRWVGKCLMVAWMGVDGWKVGGGQ